MKSWALATVILSAVPLPDRNPALENKCIQEVDIRNSVGKEFESVRVVYARGHFWMLARIPTPMGVFGLLYLREANGEYCKMMQLSPPQVSQLIQQYRSLEI